ncbi:MAG: MerR family transcriptional [Prolixibacteraceae bacterium]|nr:MAG: MerR family transcriptional [Prolixibacteraceae bacterium]
MKAEGYSIKDLEVLSGVKAHTIRIWEKRYHLLSPARTGTNIRYYSDADLRRILNVSLLVKTGFKISKVAKWEEPQLKLTVLEATEKKVTEPELVERLILFMLNFDNVGFYQLVNKIIEQKGFEDAVVKVFFVLFERIGTYWQVGSIFPAQEHYVTGILRQKLIAETDKLGVDNSNGQTMLFFLPEHEMHEMSLLFYAYLARKYGYNVIYLGQFVPFDDLIKAQSHIKIDYVFAAFINPLTREDLENYLVRLKEAFQHQKIFITGLQVRQLMPELPRTVKIVKDYREFKKYVD